MRAGAGQHIAHFYICGAQPEQQLVSALCVIQTAKTNPWWGAQHPDTRGRHETSREHTHMDCPLWTSYGFVEKLSQVMSKAAKFLSCFSAAGTGDWLGWCTSLDWLSRDKTRVRVSRARPSVHLEPPETGTAAPGPG